MSISAITDLDPTNDEAAIAAQNVAFITKRYTAFRDDATLGKRARLLDSDPNGIITKYAKVRFWIDPSGHMDGTVEAPRTMPIAVCYFEPPCTSATWADEDVGGGGNFGVFDELQGEALATAFKTVNRVLTLMNLLLEKVEIPAGKWPAGCDLVPEDTTANEVNPGE